MATTSEGSVELSDLRYKLANYAGTEMIRVPSLSASFRLAHNFCNGCAVTLVSMARKEDEIQSLRKEIVNREAELAHLKSQLKRAESQELPQDDGITVPNERTVTPPHPAALAPGQIRSGQNETSSSWRWPLSREEYKRYGRQMITPEIGLEGKPALDLLTLCELTKD